MAVRAERTQHVATQFVTGSSRYASSKVILLGDRKIPTFEIYKRNRRPLVSRDVQWTQITPSVEFRPDLVSYELFGTPDFWWRIMEVNGMKDILEFKSGRAIMVPTSVLA